MKKKRLSIHIASLIAVILIIMASFVILLVSMLISRDDVSGAKKQLCEESLDKIAKTKSFTELNCERNSIIIDYNDVELLEEKQGIDYEKIYEIIQKEVYDCYSMIPKNKEGRIPDSFKLYQEGYSLCLVCSVINFDEEIQKTTDVLDKVNGKGFYEWLIFSKVPGSEENMYKDLFGISPVSELIENSKSLDEDYPINTSKTYVVYARWNLFGVTDYFLPYKPAFCLFDRNKQGNMYCKNLMLNVAPIEHLSEKLSYVVDGHVTSTKDDVCTVIWN